MNEKIDSANDAREMAIKIYEIIYSSDEIGKYALDALIRVFVYLARKNGWNLERMQDEVKQVIEYYYTNEIDEYCPVCKNELVACVCKTVT